MNAATRLIKRLAPKALVTMEYGRVVALLDFMVDGRRFRIEIRSSVDAKRAAARVLSTPWGRPTRNLGGHVGSSGWLCLGNSCQSTLERSSMPLSTVIERVNYWTIAYTYFKQTGKWVNP